MGGGGLMGIVLSYGKEDLCAFVKLLISFRLGYLSLKQTNKFVEICKSFFTEQDIINEQCYEHAQFEGFSPEKVQSGRWPTMANK